MKRREMESSMLGLFQIIVIKGKIVSLANNKLETCSHYWPNYTIYWARGEISAKLRKVSNALTHITILHTNTAAFLLPATPLTLHQPRHPEWVNPSIVMVHLIKLCGIKNYNVSRSFFSNDTNVLNFVSMSVLHRQKGRGCGQTV